MRRQVPKNKCQKMSTVGNRHEIQVLFINFYLAGHTLSIINSSAGIYLYIRRSHFENFTQQVQNEFKIKNGKGYITQDLTRRKDRANIFAAIRHYQRCLFFFSYRNNSI